MIKSKKNTFGVLLSGLLFLLMANVAVAEDKERSAGGQGTGIESTLHVIKNKASKVDSASAGEKAAAKKALLDAVGEAIANAKSPEEAAQIIAAAVTAAPSMAVQITQSAITAAPPSLVVAITSAAVTAAPTQAAQISRAAVTLAPQQRREIVAAVPKALAKANTPAETHNPPPTPPAVGGGTAASPA